jgi:hypothetical protein
MAKEVVRFIDEKAGGIDEDGGIEMTGHEMPKEATTQKRS